MELYVGLDVGLEETSVCVIDKDGKSAAKQRFLPRRRRSAPCWRASRIACDGWEWKRRLWEYGCTANCIQPDCQ